MANWLCFHLTSLWDILAQLPEMSGLSLLRIRAAQLNVTSFPDPPSAAGTWLPEPVSDRVSD